MAAEFPTCCTFVRWKVSVLIAKLLHFLEYQALTVATAHPRAAAWLSARCSPSLRS